MNQLTTAATTTDSAYALPPDSVAYFVEYEQERNRLTSFFRLFTAIPPMIWVMLYGFAAGLAIICAWFALVFTARFPVGLFDFIAGFQRYYARVTAYIYLASDKFPGFSGDPQIPYAAHLLIGPPKETYSRAKAFFRGILYIPFYAVAYVLISVAQIGALISWFAILFTGKQPQGIQDLMDFCLGFILRAGVFASLVTEDWPKFSDASVNRSLQEAGYQGTIPPGMVMPAIAASAGPAAQPQPPAQPPAPPQPPTPPEGPSA